MARTSFIKKQMDGVFQLAYSPMCRRKEGVRGGAAERVKGRVYIGGGGSKGCSHTGKSKMEH